MRSPILSLSRSVGELVESLKRIKNPIKWRPYQRQTFDYFEENKHLFVSWSRRLGKDFGIFSKVIEKCKNNRNYRVLYFFPVIEQGKRAIFEGITDENESWLEQLVDRMDLITPQGNDKLYHSDNTVRFKNGSIIRIMGADKAGTKVGTNENVVVFSEAAHMPKLEVLLNRLISSTTRVKGKIILISTPKYGSYFNEMYLDGLNPDRWNCSVLSADDAFEDDGTPVYTEEQKQAQKDVMSEEEYEQEMGANFEISNKTSIYGRSVELASFINAEKINNKLFVSFDIGVADFTVMCLYVQTGEFSFKMIHCYGASGEATKHFVDYLESFCKDNDFSKGQAELYFPFDSVKRQIGYDRLTTVYEQYQSRGWTSILTKRIAVSEGIRIARTAIQKHWVTFEENTSVRYFLKKLKKYEWQVSKEGKSLYIPEHGKAGDAPSNFADSFETFTAHKFIEKINNQNLDGIETFFE